MRTCLQLGSGNLQAFLQAGLLLRIETDASLSMMFCGHEVKTGGLFQGCAGSNGVWR